MAVWVDDHARLGRITFLTGAPPVRREHGSRPHRRFGHHVVMLRAPEPIMVVDLFPVERRALLDLLDGLAPEDWARPTIAGDWTVKDVAAHLAPTISADSPDSVTAIA